MCMHYNVCTVLNYYTGNHGYPWTPGLRGDKGDTGNSGDRGPRGLVGMFLIAT